MSKKSTELRIRKLVTDAQGRRIVHIPKSGGSKKSANKQNAAFYVCSGKSDDKDDGDDDDDGMEDDEATIHDVVPSYPRQGRPSMIPVFRFLELIQPLLSVIIKEQTKLSSAQASNDGGGGKGGGLAHEQDACSQRNVPGYCLIPGTTNGTGGQKPCFTGDLRTWIVALEGTKVNGDSLLEEDVNLSSEPLPGELIQMRPIVEDDAQGGGFKFFKMIPMSSTWVGVPLHSHEAYVYGENGRFELSANFGEDVKSDDETDDEYAKINRFVKSTSSDVHPKYARTPNNVQLLFGAQQPALFAKILGITYRALSCYYVMDSPNFVNSNDHSYDINDRTSDLPFMFEFSQCQKVLDCYFSDVFGLDMSFVDIDAGDDEDKLDTCIFNDAASATDAVKLYSYEMTKVSYAGRFVTWFHSRRVSCRHFSLLTPHVSYAEHVRHLPLFSVPTKARRPRRPA